MISAHAPHPISLSVYYGDLCDPHVTLHRPLAGKMERLKRPRCSSSKWNNTSAFFRCHFSSFHLSPEIGPSIFGGRLSGEDNLTQLKDPVGAGGVLPTSWMGCLQIFKETG
ncbi:hypothetical protein CDAR_515541 [Caerostris darwini]|uniref:Uncharacterized protein n=1 Tax=Caerostris darwini TaxID=1538125 RepID=A0AAV4S5I2_9ARAC|nr:hypothetical protein CDAR_515541 [Caerostris darwini]